MTTACVQLRPSISHWLTRVWSCLPSQGNFLPTGLSHNTTLNLARFLDGWGNVYDGAKLSTIPWCAAAPRVGRGEPPVVPSSRSGASTPSYLAVAPRFFRRRFTTAGYTDWQGNVTAETKFTDAGGMCALFCPRHNPCGARPPSAHSLRPPSCAGTRGGNIAPFGRRSRSIQCRRASGRTLDRSGAVARAPSSPARSSPPPPRPPARAIRAKRALPTLTVLFIRR